MELRKYQEEAVDAVEKEWQQGRQHTLLVIPTGGGKTIIFSEIARRESVKFVGAAFMPLGADPPPADTINGVPTGC